VGEGSASPSEAAAYASAKVSFGIGHCSPTHNSARGPRTSSKAQSSAPHSLTAQDTALGRYDALLSEVLQTPRKCQRNTCMLRIHNLQELEEQPSSVSSKQPCQHLGNAFSQMSRFATTPSVNTWANNTNSTLDDHIVKLHENSNRWVEEDKAALRRS
jgi:hypothetical protein